MKTTQGKIDDFLLNKAPKNELTCAEAFALAKTGGIVPAEIGRAAQHLGIKIRDCQLGCFGAIKER